MVKASTTVVVLMLMLVCLPSLAQNPPQPPRDDKDTHENPRPKQSAYQLAALDAGSDFELTMMDLPVFLISGAVWGVPTLVDKDLPPPDCSMCNKNDINSVDRTAVGFDSSEARAISHVMVLSIPGIVLGLSVFDLKKWGWTGVFEDVIMILEAMTITGMTHQVVRHAIERPRPYMYREELDPDRARGNSDDGHSFFSGHTATAFAASTAFAYIFSIRNPKSRLRPLVWSLALGLSTTVGVMRVIGGEHFWSDAGASMVIGSGFGLMTPIFHQVKKTHPKAPDLVMTPQYVGVHYQF